MPTRPAPPAEQSSGTDVAGIDPDRLGTVQCALLNWFATHGRDLPWRRTRDPWAILVSEVMLQQIQVSRAIPFYEAFLARFPTVAALATAPLAEAIRVWGDLGRYRRVVNLHRTARLVVADHGGAIPPDVATLKTLPGIGPYTAGAVACFAFGQDTAFADTNIRRVLYRVFDGSDLPAAARPAAIDRIATSAVPVGHGWAWNQGLMDLGATICTARAPRCERCPLRDPCRAYPAILELVPVTKRAPARPAYRYEGSDRYYRGRVLAHLREHSTGADAATGIALPLLGAAVRPDFGDDHLPWLHGVVGSLAKDGLAVAEERPMYDAGAGGADAEVEVRVKLPD